jgi:hypothetical protein
MIDPTGRSKTAGRSTASGKKPVMVHGSWAGDGRG